MLALRPLSCIPVLPVSPANGVRLPEKGLVMIWDKTIRPGAVRVWLRLAALCGIACLPTGCAREDEMTLRTRLSHWISLGDTIGFSARLDCAAGAFAVVDPQIKSALPVATGMGEALITLRRLGRVALDDPAQSPDRGIVEATHGAPPVGMAMRGAALGALGCMTPPVEDAFHHALKAEDALLIWDAKHRTLILLDRARGRLVVAMGAR